MPLLKKGMISFQSFPDLLHSHIHGCFVFIIYTSLVSHFVPFKVSPAGLLGRFAPLGFTLAFTVVSLPRALCFALAFSVAWLLQALCSQSLCSIKLSATRSNLPRFALRILSSQTFLKKKKKKKKKCSETHRN